MYAGVRIDRPTPRVGWMRWSRRTNQQQSSQEASQLFRGKENLQHVLGFNFKITINHGRRQLIWERIYHKGAGILDFLK